MLRLVQSRNWRKQRFLCVNGFEAQKRHDFDHRSGRLVLVDATYTIRRRNVNDFTKHDSVCHDDTPIDCTLWHFNVVIIFQSSVCLLLLPPLLFPSRLFKQSTSTLEFQNSKCISKVQIQFHECAMNLKIWKKKSRGGNFPMHWVKTRDWCIGPSSYQAVN